MPSSSHQSSNKLPRKPNKPPKEKWWIIRDILQERRRSGKIEYLVDWENDSETGEQYPPTWVSQVAPPHQCCSDLQRLQAGTSLQRLFSTGRKRKKQRRLANQQNIQATLSTLSTPRTKRKERPAIRKEQENKVHLPMVSHFTLLRAVNPSSHLASEREINVKAAQKRLTTQILRIQ